MPANKDQDVFTLSVQALQSTGLNFFDHVKDHAKENKNQNTSGSVREVSRSTEKKEESSGGKKVEVESYVVQLSDGSSYTFEFKRTPVGDDSDNGKSRDAFTLSLKGVKSEEEAKKRFDSFHDMVHGYYLETHPKNTPLMVYVGGGGKWHDVGMESAKNSLQKYAGQFREKGIDVYLNDRLIKPLQPEQDQQEEKQASTSTSRMKKPWQVPKVPKLKRD